MVPLRRAPVFALACVLSLSSVQAFAEANRKKPEKARAEPSPVDVDTAEQLYAKLDYDRANETAERVVKQKDLSHGELVRAYRILAITHAILGREEQARDAFFQLLVLDPDVTVDSNLGPKVSTPFMEARGQFRSLPARPGLEVVPNVRQSGGQLRVTTRDPTRIARRVIVGYRWSSASDFTLTTLPVGEASVDVSPATAGRTRLDYYAVALDEQGSAVFEAGNAQAPKSAFAEAGAEPAGPSAPKDKTEPAKRGSVFTSPVFWAVAGAVVVGGATATFFALRPEDPPTKAALGPRIACGNEPCR